MRLGWPAVEPGLPRLAVCGSRLQRVGLCGAALGMGALHAPRLDRRARAHRAVRRRADRRLGLVGLHHADEQSWSAHAATGPRPLQSQRSPRRRVLHAGIPRCGLCRPADPRGRRRITGVPGSARRDAAERRATARAALVRDDVRAESAGRAPGLIPATLTLRGRADRHRGGLVFPKSVMQGNSNCAMVTGTTAAGDGVRDRRHAASATHLAPRFRAPSRFAPWRGAGRRAAARHAVVG